jgi:hypothetical protein
VQLVLNRFGGCISLSGFTDILLPCICLYCGCVWQNMCCSLGRNEQLLITLIEILHNNSCAIIDGFSISCCVSMGFLQRREARMSFLTLVSMSLIFLGDISRCCEMMCVKRPLLHNMFMFCSRICNLCHSYIFSLNQL